ncbi:MAG: hypothetical protein FWG52_05100 [Proteobacteria bacterium]|nr:hypothetical protein [Pseudomonadota bacterium]
MGQSYARAPVTAQAQACAVTGAGRLPQNFGGMLRQVFARADSGVTAA